MLDFLLTTFSIYATAVLAAFLVNKSNQRKGLKGIDNKELVKPTLLLSVLYGYVLKLVIPPHVLEQYVLRFYDEDCSVCVSEGICIGGKSCGSECACGCDTVAKMYSPFEQDSGGNWGKIIFNKQKYQEHRDAVPVKIEITYGNQENSTQVSNQRIE